MRIYNNISDNELVAFLREGDAAAYTEIYDRYFQLMFVFAYKKLRDEELAKDFVQELFVKLWERREAVSEENNFRAYLYVALRNRILDYFSHQNVEAKYIDFLSSYYSDISFQNADFKIREKQLADYIEKQIKTLPPKMQLIFKMSRKQFLSHKEIASELKTTENNVTTQITSALRILKTKLNRIVIFMFV